MDKETLPFYNGVKGTVAVHADAIAMRRFSRTRFRQLCTRGLDIRWGKKFRDIELADGGPSVVLFEDGTTATADLVIGCDGSSSQVRKWLFRGPAGEVKSSNWVSCSGVVNYQSAELARFIRAPHPLTAIGYLPNGLVFNAGKYPYILVRLRAIFWGEILTARIRSYSAICSRPG